MHTDTLIWLFLVVFMLHDFEEIIMMAAWTTKNCAELERRWPRFMRRMLALTGGLSTPAFALAVGVLFSVIAAAIVLVVELRLYALWGTMLLVFSLHFLAHIAQWVVMRRYVPVILTSLPGAVYCAAAFWHVRRVLNISWGDILFYTPPLIFLLGFVFAGALALARRFDRWQKVYAKPGHS